MGAGTLEKVISYKSITVPATCTNAGENVLGQRRDVSNEKFEKVTGRIFVSEFVHCA